VEPTSASTRTSVERKLQGSLRISVAHHPIQKLFVPWNTCPSTVGKNRIVNTAINAKPMLLDTLLTSAVLHLPLIAEESVFATIMSSAATKVVVSVSAMVALAPPLAVHAELSVDRHIVSMDKNAVLLPAGFAWTLDSLVHHQSASHVETPFAHWATCVATNHVKFVLHPMVFAPWRFAPHVAVNSVTMDRNAATRVVESVWPLEALATRISANLVEK